MTYQSYPGMPNRRKHVEIKSTQAHRSSTHILEYPLEIQQQLPRDSATYMLVA